MVEFSSRNFSIYIIETATARVLDILDADADGYWSFTPQEDYLVYTALDKQAELRPGVLAWQAGLWNTKTRKLETLLKTNGRIRGSASDGRTFLAADWPDAAFAENGILTLWDVDPAKQRPRATLKTS